MTELIIIVNDLFEMSIPCMQKANCIHATIRNGDLITYAHHTNDAKMYDHEIRWNSVYL